MLDAASAYWSIPLHETNKEKNAFSVSRGKFEFEVMPYGLCNAGASYQRMICVCQVYRTKEFWHTLMILSYLTDISTNI